MMFWIEETKDKHPDPDLVYLMYELDQERHEYLQVSKQMILTLDINRDMSYYKQVVPVGNLKFIQTALSKIHNVNSMNPIEVPKILRTSEFLKRNYTICKSKDLPSEGYYFVKGVSHLKEFSYTGAIEYIHEGPIGEYSIHFKEDGLYQLSEVVTILSEYRVFVHHDEIIAIHWYDGDCKVFPDVITIRKMITQYKSDNDRPRAYTIDVAVIYSRGTAILEVHPWVSVGLYGYMFNQLIPYCYRDGFQYYIDINKPLEI